MIREGVMQLGDWELELHPDTPYAIRDAVTQLSAVVVFPEHVDAADLTDPDRDYALYSGVVTRPGPYFTIGGHGLAYWMGTGDLYYTTDLVGSSLPQQASVNGGVGVSMTSFLTNILGHVNVGLTTGTVVDPTSGLQTIAQTTVWQSLREVVDGVCKRYEIEWRIRPTFELDAAPASDLYGATPKAVITASPAGREMGFRGIEALIERRMDYFDWANRVIVQGRAGLGISGSPSVGAAPRGMDGRKVWATVVVDGADIGIYDEQFAASRLLTKYTVPAQSVTVTSDDYEISGEVVAGSRVYVWDPESGITSGANPIEWRGDTIYPMLFRVVGVRWPVREGMGVYIRSYDFTTGAGPNYIDLSPYVVWETGSTEYEISYDFNLNWRG